MFQNNKTHKLIQDKTDQANLGDSPVSLFLNTNCVKIKPDYTVRGTIEIFRTHKISGAPVVDYRDIVIGVISEYDLLIQAASSKLSSPIVFKTKIVAIYPETSLKEVLVILYKQKLKWMPVINSNGFLQGVISRIDVLSYIVSHSPKDL